MAGPAGPETQPKQGGAMEWNRSRAATRGALSDEARKARRVLAAIEARREQQAARSWSWHEQEEEDWGPWPAPRTPPTRRLRQERPCVCLMSACVWVACVCGCVDGWHVCACGMCGCGCVCGSHVCACVYVCVCVCLSFVCVCGWRACACACVGVPLCLLWLHVCV